VAISGSYNHFHNTESPCNHVDQKSVNNCDSVSNDIECNSVTLCALPQGDSGQKRDLIKCVNQFVNSFDSGSNVVDCNLVTSCEMPQGNLAHASDLVKCSKNFSVLDVNASPFVVKTPGSLSTHVGLESKNNSVCNNDGAFISTSCQDIDGILPSPYINVDANRNHAGVSVYTSADVKGF
jgi:hypothetical protein